MGVAIRAPSVSEGFMLMESQPIACTPGSEKVYASPATLWLTLRKALFLAYDPTMRIT